jgi:hypothetical protein
MMIAAQVARLAPLALAVYAAMTCRRATSALARHLGIRCPLRSTNFALENFGLTRTAFDEVDLWLGPMAEPSRTHS